jgi:hypothetical protein
VPRIGSSSSSFPIWVATGHCCIGGGHASEQPDYWYETSSPPSRSRYTVGLAGFRFPPDVIVLATRWYLRFGLSYATLRSCWLNAGSRSTTSPSTDGFSGSRRCWQRLPTPAGTRGFRTSAARKRAELWTPATAVASRGHRGSVPAGQPAASPLVVAPAAIPWCRLGLGAPGARPASARTHEPGRIVPDEPIGVDCPR